MPAIFPILTNNESAQLESALLNNDETKIWNAMNSVGSSLAQALLNDFKEIGPLPENPNILVLAGTGHNAGDAILSASEILKYYPKAQIKVFFALGEGKLKPLVKMALATLPSYKTISLQDLMNDQFDLSLDGILGLSFHPPVENPLLEIFHSINQHPHIRLRASVDIPSGLLLKADFSYATGTPKTVLFKEQYQNVVGRIRFIDIGFFKNDYKGPQSSHEFLLSSEILAPLRSLRDPNTNKRNYGHLYILSGSKNYPGALMMSVKSAIKSGVGLITVFTPESLVPSFAAEAPEAIWVPFPETKTGSLALSGKNLLLNQLPKGTALLMGPGIGDEPESLQLVSEIVQQCHLPIIIDASALVPNTFSQINKRPTDSSPIIATPHAGEFKRIAQEKSLIDWNLTTNVITLLKGPISKIVHEGIIYNSCFGGPILARGGSGDILSGLIGGLVAQYPTNPFNALAQALVWHGMAADALARDKGQIAVRTTDLCDYLSPILHNPQ